MIGGADWAGYLRFRDRFAEVLDERLYTIDWLDAQVIGGAVRFWCSDEAGIIAELKFYPTGAVDIHGLIAAGELEAIEALIEQAEGWARAVGCLGAIIESRPGWARVLKAKGYDTHQVSLRKEL